MKNNLIPILVGTMVVTLVAAVEISVDNNFESGTLFPWIEQSEYGVKWKIENQNSPWKPENGAPLLFNGANYLRVDRGTSLAFGVAILRSPVFRVLPSTSETFFSFSFWIRSKWPQFTNLELYLGKNGNEGLLLNLYEYSSVDNRNWTESKVKITDDTHSNLTLVFYAYCGTSAEDAVAIDDLYFSADTILTTTESTALTTSSPFSNTFPTSSSGTNWASSTDPIATSPTTSTTTMSPTTSTTTMSSTTSTITTPPTTTTRRTISSKTTASSSTTETLTSISSSTPSSTDPTDSTEETSTITTDSTTILAEDRCPNFLQGDSSVPCWIIGTQCYCFYNGTSQQNWTVADQFCREGSMTLLTIETAEEDQMIYDHVFSTSEIPSSLYWTAGRYSQEGNDRWEWATNAPYQPLNYTNWSVDEPNGDYATNNYCVYANFNADFTGYWVDEKCGEPGFRFICEQRD